MGWSTSELARLTGTTVNTIRHYHRLHLLAEPERMSNGYKQYGASHLLRLLQIRRMRELGIQLSDIDSVQGDLEQQQLALKHLDGELSDRIAALENVRAEIAQLLEHGASIDTAPGFADIAAALTIPDRGLMSLYSRLFDESTMSDFKSIMANNPSPDEREFNELPEDADEDARVRLAEKIAPDMKRQLEEQPWLLAPTDRMAGDKRMGRNAIISLVGELYSDAQIDVMQRAFIQVFPTLDIPAEDRDRFIAFIKEAEREEMSRQRGAEDGTAGNRETA